MSETLVLDASYIPVSKTSWQKAIVHVLIDKVAEVVDEYPDKYIHTPSWAVKMPSVIRLIKPTPRKKAIKFSRDNVYQRDHGKCQYCGFRISRGEATFDHVIPRSQGGQTVWENVVISCTGCNQRKGGRTPEQAKMKLLSIPIRPKKLGNTGLDITFKPGMPEAWKSWLRNVVYWKGELENP